MHQVFVSWSGGKDSCFACYRAIQNGLKVGYLANMVTEDGKWSWSHRLTAEWLRMQAKAIGIPLIQWPTTSANYEAEFKNMLRYLKQEGVTDGVFGDIDFEEHRQWIERVCLEGGIVSHLPLWGEEQSQIVRDFITVGFEAVVVTTKADLLGEEWLGRKLDSNFIADLGKLKHITPCGEAGEYHTLVTNGPLFNQRLEILEASQVLKDGYWFLEILKSRLWAK